MLYWSTMLCVPLWMRRHHRALQLLPGNMGSVPATKGGFITLRLRQNGRHLADDSFKCIFLNEDVWIWLKISLKFVPKGSINNIPSLVQIMAWRRPDAKPLSEPMMVRLPIYIKKKVYASLSLNELSNFLRPIIFPFPFLFFRIFKKPLCYLFNSKYIQSSAVIMRSNIARYYINNCRNWYRISIRCWIHIRHPYISLTSELWGVFCEYLWENWQRYNGTALYLNSVDPT